MNNKNALIIFSRLPIGSETKTRLSPVLNEAEREALQRAFWSDIFNAVLKFQDLKNFSSTDIFLYWTGGGDINNYKNIIPNKFRLREQRNFNDLGERMSAALSEIFADNYQKAVLIGTDVPDVTQYHIKNAFDALDNADIVIAPTFDGGYWLIGMRRFLPEVFKLKSWGNQDVLGATLEHIKSMKLNFKLTDTLLDIDTPEDIKLFLSRHNNYDFQDKNSAALSYLRNDCVIHALKKFICSSV